jgi:intracellular sulfur oxidation DsrE/DsrF family protein
MRVAALLLAAPLLSLGLSGWFAETAEAQVFKDDSVCWSCREDTTPVPKMQPMIRKKAAAVKVQAQSKQLTNAAATHRRADPASPIAIQNKLAIQVDQNDKAIMDLALNNARNVIDYYKSIGETVAVEVVTYGPGLHMLRSDTSPVKERIGPMTLEYPTIAFFACANTQANQSKAEGKSVPLISEAKLTPSGVVRLMELQRQGYAYIRP